MGRCRGGSATGARDRCEQNGNRKGAELVASAPESLFSLLGMRIVAGVPSYDVAPSGERFLFTKSFGTTDQDSRTLSRIIVVQNWFQELERLVPTR